MPRSTPLRSQGLLYCGEMIEYSNLRAKLRKGLRAGGKMAHKRQPQGGQNLKNTGGEPLRGWRTCRPHGIDDVALYSWNMIWVPED